MCTPIIDQSNFYYFVGCSALGSHVDCNKTWFWSVLTTLWIITIVIIIIVILITITYFYSYFYFWKNLQLQYRCYSVAEFAGHDLKISHRQQICNFLILCFRAS